MSSSGRKKESGAAFRSKRKAREDENKILAASAKKNFNPATSVTVNQENVEVEADSDDCK